MGSKHFRRFLFPTFLVLSVAIVLSGCGSGAGTSSGGGGSAAKTAAVNGAVEVLQKQLTAMGITGLSLASTVPSSTGGMRVASIPMGDGGVTAAFADYQNLGLGTDLGVKSNISSSGNFTSSVDLTGGAAIVTCHIQKDADGGGISSAADKELIKKAIVLPPDAAGGTVTVSCNDASTGAAAQIFGSKEVKEAIATLSKVDPKTCASLVNAVAKVLIEKLPEIQRGSLVRSGDETLGDSGIPKTAEDEIAGTVGDNKEITQVGKTAQGLGAVANTGLEKDEKKLESNRVQIAKAFLTLTGGTEQSSGGLAEVLAKDTRTLTLGELIAKAAPQEGKTIPNTLTAKAVVDNLKQKVTEMETYFASIREGKASFSDGPGGGPQGGGGPPVHIMAAIAQYMKTHPAALDTKFDAFTWPAMCELFNEPTLANGTVNTMATLGALDIKVAGRDLRKGDIGIDFHPDFEAAGTSIGGMKQESKIQINVMGFGGMSKATSCVVKVGSGSAEKTYTLIKYDLSKVTSKFKPDVLFVGSPRGQLDRYLVDQWGLTDATVTAVDIPISTSQIDASGNLTMTAIVSDSTATELTRKTETRPFGMIGGGGGGPPGAGGNESVMITVKSPVPNGPNTPPELIPTRSKINVLASAQVTGTLPAGVTEKDLRYKIRVDQMDFAGGQPPAPGGSGDKGGSTSNFKPKSVYESPLLKQPIVTIDPLTEDGMYFLAIEVLAEASAGYPMHLGGGGTAFMYGSATNVFKDEGFKRFAGSQINEKQFELKDLTVDVLVKNRPSGITASLYAMVFKFPDFSQGQKTPTVVVQALVDSTSNKATLTIPADKLATLHGGWTIGVYADINGNKTWDDPKPDPSKILDALKVELPFLTPPGQHQELRGNKLIMVNDRTRAEEDLKTVTIDFDAIKGAFGPPPSGGNPGGSPPPTSQPGGSPPPTGQPGGSPPPTGSPKP